MHIPDKKGLRDFGIVTGALFTGLFGLLFPWLFSLDFPIWPWIIAGVLWLWALLIPKTLKWVYQPWMSLAMLIGWINTRIILAIVFFLIMTPIGIIMHIFGKKTIQNKPSQCESYRNITHSRSPKDMELPF